MASNWPFETISETKSTKNGTELFDFKFKEVECTVESEYGTDAGEWYGVTFQEDAVDEEKGFKPIWHPKGKWDEAEHRFLEYAGKRHEGGSSVIVRLRQREYIGRDGDKRTGFDIQDWRAGTGNAQPQTQQPQLQQAVTETQKLSGSIQTNRDVAISKGRAANSLTEILSAILSAPKTNDMKWFLDQTSWDSKEDLAKEWFESYQDSKDGKVPYMRIDADKLIEEIEESEGKEKVEGSW